MVVIIFVLCLNAVLGATNNNSASNPGFNLYQGVLEADILLGKCNHSSAFEVYTFFAVRNDTGYLVLESNNLSRFPNLLIQNASTSDQGRYHCALNYQGSRYVLEKYVLTWKDVFRLQLNISFSWINEYKARNGLKMLWQIEEMIDSYYQRSKTFGTTYVDDKFEHNYTVVNVAVKKGSNENIIEATTAIRSAIKIGQPLVAKHFKDFNISDVRITPLDWCMAEIIEEEQFKAKLKYDITRASSSPVSKQCPYNKHQRVYRYCLDNFPNISEWGKVNVTQCKNKLEATTKLKILNGVNVTSQSVVEVSENLRRIINNDTLNNSDIVLVTSVVKKIIESLKMTQKNENQTDIITENILDVANNLLDTNRELIAKSNETRHTTSTFLESLDAIAVYATRQSTKQQKVFKKQNIALAVQNSSNSFTFIARDENNTLDIQSVVDEGVNQASLAQLFVPQSLLERVNSTLVYSYIFRSPLLFSKPFENQTIQSIVMAASVPERKISNLYDPVVITFQVKNADEPNKSKSSTCQYWVPEEHAWSKKGCKTLPGKLDGTINCECSHLTNFALLLDINQSGFNPLSLKVITWIGCGISIFGLLLTVISFTAFSNLRKKLPSKILLCLSCSLLVLLISFFIGVERVKPRLGCQFVATLIQYFLLATFFWMSVQGWILYHNFVNIFGGQQDEKTFLIKSNLFAWGGPFVITSITAGVATDSLGPKTKDDIQFCVVQGLPFYIGVVVPVVLIFTKNFIVLVLVLRGIGKSRFNKDRKGQLLTSTRIAFSCSILLGTAWIFGILAVGYLRYVFQWFFCVFNSLQGSFIFLFYTARNPEARKHWRRAFGFKQSGAFSSTFGKSSNDHGSSVDASSLKMKVVPDYKRSTSSYT